jgi:hypothetical protein
MNNKRVLTCKNHPDLRWSTKREPGRTLFFNGIPDGTGLYHDGSGVSTTHLRPDGSVVQECTCSAGDLIPAPEDRLVNPDLYSVDVEVPDDPKMIHYGRTPYVACGEKHEVHSTMTRADVTCPECLAGIAAREAQKVAGNSNPGQV